MKHVETVSRHDLPLRPSYRDVIDYFEHELLEAGFDLTKEIHYKVKYMLAASLVQVVFIQHDRFRVRPANEFYPLAII